MVNRQLQTYYFGAEGNLIFEEHLYIGAASAVKNPDNTYLTLAKVVITEIKRAQELALAGRDSEIVISPQLEVLIAVPDIELLELSSDFFEAANNDDIIPVCNELSINDLNQLSFEPESDDNEIELDVEDNIVNLRENSDSIDSLFELSVDIDDDDVKTFDLEVGASPDISDDIVYEDVISRDCINAVSTDPNGPEVGIAELTELDELFKDDTSLLDDTWHDTQVESSVENNQESSDYIEVSDSELDDLLVIEDSTNFYDRLDKGDTELTVVQLFGSYFDDDDNVSDSKTPTSSDAIVSLTSNNVDITSVSNNQLFETDVLFEADIFDAVDETLEHGDIDSVDDIDSLFGAPTPTEPEFSLSNDDFADFWTNIDVAASPIDYDDVGEYLEESLKAAIENTGIFDTYIEPAQDKENHHTSIDLIQDTDLFEELTPSQIKAVQNVDDNAIHSIPSVTGITHEDNLTLNNYVTDEINVPSDINLDSAFIDFDFESNQLISLEPTQDTEDNIILDGADSRDAANNDIAVLNDDNSSTEHSITDNNDYIEDSEFAALEALLGNEHYTSTPVANQGANNIDIDNNIDEFGDLEKMLASERDKTTSSNNAPLVQRNTSRRSTARFEQLMKVSVKHLDDMSNKGGGVGC